MTLGKGSDQVDIIWSMQCLPPTPNWEGDSSRFTNVVFHSSTHHWFSGFMNSSRQHRHEFYILCALQSLMGTMLAYGKEEGECDSADEQSHSATAKLEPRDKGPKGGAVLQRLRS
jgi:hypothetical protein